MYEWIKAVVPRLLRVEAARPEPLPGYREGRFVQVVRACPAYLRYRLFYWALYASAWLASVLAVSVILLSIDERFVWLVVPLAGLAVFKAAVLYVTTRLDYEMRWYVLTDRSLLIRQGVWVVKEVCTTFANAQSVRVTQGPLQRLFGFSNVEVYTAGRGGSDEANGQRRHRAVLAGLANPAEVRGLVLDLLERHRTAGLGDPDDHAGGRISLLDAGLLHEIWDEAKELRVVLS
jgi:membrane protein YdbS with pleckstrin-like domain